MNWSIDSELRSILVCPICRGDLRDVERGLLCAADDVVFPVVDGVPMMLKELSVKPTDAERLQAEPA